MSELKEVTVSGSVGKQVFPSTRPVKVRSVILVAVSAAVATIRDGNNSGEVKLVTIGPAGNTNQVVFDPCVRFDKGMHVKVIGTSSKVYLEID